MHTTHRERCTRAIHRGTHFHRRGVRTCRRSHAILLVAVPGHCSSSSSSSRGPQQPKLMTGKCLRALGRTRSLSRLTSLRYWSSTVSNFVVQAEMDPGSTSTFELLCHVCPSVSFFFIVVSIFQRPPLEGLCMISLSAYDQVFLEGSPFQSVCQRDATCIPLATVYRNTGSLVNWRG